MPRPTRHGDDISFTTNMQNVDETDSLSMKVLKINTENRIALWVQGLVCYRSMLNISSGTISPEKSLNVTRFFNNFIKTIT